MSHEPLAPSNEVAKKPSNELKLEIPNLENSSFSNIRFLSSGAYGAVYSCTDKNSKQALALKFIPLDGKKSICPTTIREIGLLKKLDHPNIIRMKNVSQISNGVIMIFEFLTYDLKKYCDQNRNNISHTWIQKCIYQILLGLCYLHEREIIHRDLKPQNILVGDNGNVVKIADFGLARNVSIPRSNLTNDVVTLWYRAPEILLGKQKYDFSLDLWSVGCIFGELYNNRAIFQASSQIALLYDIFQKLGTPDENIWPELIQMPFFQPKFPKWKPKSFQKIFPTMEDEGIDLISQLLTYDSKHRIQTKDTLLHKYFEIEIKI